MALPTINIKYFTNMYKQIMYNIMKFLESCEKKTCIMNLL